MSTVLDHELLLLLQEMIRIPSVNPNLEAEGTGESRLAEYLGQFMADAGFEVQFQEFAPGRKNVIGILKGSGGGKSLMLNGHLDTVGVKQMDIDPFDPVLRDGKIFGRGSMDMKSGVAAMIMAAKQVRDSGTQLSGDIIVTCVGDEEYLSKGTEKILEAYTADAAVVTEPTGMDLVLAHKGFVWCKVHVHGKAAHGSRPEEGVDAIFHAGILLHELARWEKEELPKRQHPLLGRPSLHGSKIQGGTEISVYPHLCEIEMEWRTLPGEDAQFVEEQLLEILARASQIQPDLKYTYEINFERKPLEVSPSAEIVRLLDSAFEEIQGHQASHGGIAFWTDASLLAAANIPSVIFGPSGKGLHAASEHVDLESVKACTKILHKLILDYCK